MIVERGQPFNQLNKIAWVIADDDHLKGEREGVVEGNIFNGPLLSVADLHISQHKIN